MKYYHVDVFSNKPFSGNGLTIFINPNILEKPLMQLITQEMRQFESIFLSEISPNTFRAHIFTMEEELDFAGHPIIGAAAMIHDINAKTADEYTCTFELNEKSVVVQTIKHDKYYSAKMNQGKPQFLNTLSKEQELSFLSYFNLTEADKFEDLPLQTISTGLPYLIIPIKKESLSKIKVTIPNLEEKLEEVNAKFFYILDVASLEGRTWDNFGLVEDIATGSAAGPVGAYLVSNKLAVTNTEIILKQGSFLGRPSELKIIVSGSENEIGAIYVTGDVYKMGTGELLDL
ncbi:PhzF family phenazine biosynthesis protein [Flavobacterium wongokense]|uniref:PhzF family phenazine biosynthesis protein n=1 Tax=Flavobacterium wongokense TaxID=2910674 RepID=UPI001F2EE52F|nr:PhzF family phenazine biosynthesis protein [Flavobacterium sp. WG47]MCF6133152.1 PhzF family phenazine biosynthesis protein [Flavobacterium sp. WG47]